MRTKRFTIILNEANEFSDSAKDYSSSLDDSILNKQEKIKKAQEDIKKREESDKNLEIETKESQRYNLEQITQKKASYAVTKSPDEQKRIRLELVRLETERKRIADVLKNIQIDKQEFIKNKQEEIKDTQEGIKKDQDMKNRLQQTIKASEDAAKTEKGPAPQAQITAEGEEDYLDKYGFVIKRKFARMEEQENISSKKKTLIVNFDKSTKTPFQVKFTERGFLIGDTRLSFEFLEAALSKEVNIVLENGTGLVLDAIRMQKILKYKDRI
jgi:hypothetical protein